MGNICHAGPVLRDESTTTTATAAAPKRVPNFGKDPTLKKEDFIFSNVKGPTCLTKLPGSINGQQFLIENCTDCDIFLLDNCTSVQIDECTNCRIIVGPCESSLFLRNCKSSTIVCAVQQFRTRDCDDVDVYLYSATEPIIELSTKMRFACFPLSYFSLQHQMDRAGFSIWNNQWSEIYNFTPDHGTWKPLSMSCHESPLAESCKIRRNDGSVTVWTLPVAIAEDVGINVQATDLVIPLTAGASARREDVTTLVVVFVSPLVKLMLEFVHAMVAADDESEAVVLTRTKQMKLSAAQAKALLPSPPQQHLPTKAVEAAKSTAGSVIMEFQGAGCYTRLSNVKATTKLAEDAGFTSSILPSSDDTTARQMSEKVFVEWKETV